MTYSGHDHEEISGHMRTVTPRVSMNIAGKEIAQTPLSSAPPFGMAATLQTGTKMHTPAAHRPSSVHKR